MHEDARTPGLLGRLAYWTAISGGAGLSPTWPGTVGAAVGVPFALVFAWSLPLVAALACVALFAVGVWAAGEVATMTGKDDPQIVVIDETLGCAMALLMLPVDPLWWVLGFLAFRYFDIAKPWPINALQERVKGGLGIMLDDVAAGVAAGVAVLLLKYLADTVLG